MLIAFSKILGSPAWCPTGNAVRPFSKDGPVPEPANARAVLKDTRDGVCARPACPTDASDPKVLAAVLGARPSTPRCDRFCAAEGRPEARSERQPALPHWASATAKGEGCIERVCMSPTDTMVISATAVASAPPAGCMAPRNPIFFLSRMSSVPALDWHTERPRASPARHRESGQGKVCCGCRGFAEARRLDELSPTASRLPRDRAFVRFRVRRGLIDRAGSDRRCWIDTRGSR